MSETSFCRILLVDVVIIPGSGRTTEGGEQNKHLVLQYVIHLRQTRCDGREQPLCFSDEYAHHQELHHLCFVCLSYQTDKSDTFDTF